MRHRQAERRGSRGKKKDTENPLNQMSEPRESWKNILTDEKRSRKVQK